MAYLRLNYEDLKTFCEKVYAGYGFTEEESRIITEVLLAADLYGIESHGVQRMIRYHKEITWSKWTQSPRSSVRHRFLP